MELECYPTSDRPPEIVAGRPDRAWMDSFMARHPYRCLPLAMANTTGWEILCPMAFTLEWNGGKLQEDIKMTPDRPNPDFHRFASTPRLGANMDGILHEPGTESQTQRGIVIPRCEDRHPAHPAVVARSVR